MGAGIYAYESSGSIEGCDITGNLGIPDSQGFSWGGGISCYESSPEISICAVSDNFAWRGGGISCYGSSPSIGACSLVENTANQGGGIYLQGDPSAVVFDCYLEGNVATPDSDGYSDGGGIACLEGSPTVRDCTFVRNSAVSGGGLDFEESSPVITNCLILDNAGIPNKMGRSWAGGLSSYRSSSRIDGCTISGNSAWMGAGLVLGDLPTGITDSEVTNCIITGNVAAPSPEGDCRGGGISCYSRFSLIRDCSICDNTASIGGALYCFLGGASAISDCIIWGNADKMIYLRDEAVVAIVHTCIEGGYEGEGNIQADPLFVTGPFGDYYLSCQGAGQRENSPCVDAGSDSAENLRLGQLTTRTDSEADAGVVDMGYHYPIYLGEATIECSLNASRFRPGDYLVGSLKVANDGPDIEVDVYVAFVLPDGAIFCITPHGGLIGEILPWIRYMPLPENYSFGPAPMFQTTVPDGLPFGDYLFAAALSSPERFEVIGDIALFPFTLRAETISTVYE